jgi:hypothetical protein
VIDWVAPTGVLNQHVNIYPPFHHRAVRNTSSDERVLRDTGFQVEALNLECCGFVGWFEFTKDHGALSRQNATDQFPPRIAKSTVDGFSRILQAGELGKFAITSTSRLRVEHLHNRVKETATIQCAES